MRKWVIKPFSQGHIASKLWSRYLIPGSSAPEPNPTNTSQYSLPSKFKATYKLKGNQQYPPEAAIFWKVFLAFGMAAFGSFNYLQWFVYMHKHMHIQNKHTNICTHTNIYKHIYTQAHTCMHTYTHTVGIELSFFFFLTTLDSIF